MFSQICNITSTDYDTFITTASAGAVEKSRITRGLSQGAALIIEAEIHFYKLVNC